MVVDGSKRGAGLDRRSFIKLAAGGVAGSWILAACGSGDGASGSTAAPGGSTSGLADNKGSVKIVTWETYHNQPWLDAYSEASGVKVEQVLAGSVDEMFSKVRAADDIDLVYYDIGSIPRYIEAGLASPIDLSLVTSALGTVAPGLPWKDAATHDGQVYGVPYNWGTQPLMWNAEVITTPPDSWQVLWDPEFAGRVTMPDDSYIGMAMVGLAVGVPDPYNFREEDWETVRAKLAELRPQIQTLTQGYDVAQSLYASGEAVVGYCQNVAIVFALQDEGLDFQFGFPSEGTPFWIDCSNFTPNGQRQEVYDFVNAINSPDWQVRFISETGAAGVVTPEVAEGGVPADVLARTEIPSQQIDGYWDRMSPLQNPEDFDRRLELWNEFKAGVLN